MYRELIASSLFPRGFLGKMFFDQRYPMNLYSHFNLSPKTTIKIIELTQEYIEKEKSIDDGFIEKLNSLIK